MRKKHYLILGNILIFGIVLISTYVRLKTVTIKDIVDNPAFYEGKVVTIKCKSGGWSRCQACKLTAVSESDVCVYDKMGCIYAGGAEIISTGERLGPAFPVDQSITLKATVILNNGVATLRGTN